MAFNPWATRKVAREDTPATPIAESPDYPTPQHGEYAAPSLESGDAYTDEFGWANRSLRPSAVEYPSAQRLMTIPRVDYRPDPVRPPEEWWNRLDRDDAQRHTVEFQDADGWTELKGVAPGDKRWADNPRRTPPAEPRPTLSMAPSTYQFVRPFDQHSARYLNGTHFSMADHRRDYDILGMAPVRSLRNTYRLEPAPWDTDIVDTPPPAPPINARLQGTELPFGPRSYRL